VAIVGTGLAGLTAARVLAQRGFELDLFERHGYLGGKVGAWEVPGPAGKPVFTEHGFHAFFPHYYNLRRIFAELGITRSFRNIDDYLILTRDGGRYSFLGLETTPVLNILHMLQRKVYTLNDVLLNPRTMALKALLEYRPESTFERFDHVSFADFTRQTRLPASLKLIFNSFSRAFFAQPDLMSMAELIKSFHFFFLSQDGGLVYDYPDDSYELSLLAPFGQALEVDHARIHLDTPVERIGLGQDGKFELMDNSYDYLIFAPDVAGARRIVENSPELTSRFPLFTRQVGGIKVAQRYAVLRLWLDRDFGQDLPGFVITEHAPVLDSVSFYPRLERSARAQADQTGGGVFELHSYAVPDSVTTREQVRERFLAEFADYFPQFKQAKILAEHLQVNRDFTAFHTGLWRERPGTVTEVPKLFLAGDWVKLPLPAMLMEAAVTSGLLAANALLEQEGLQTELVESVPPVGLLAGRRR
jgi:isorenieratene synthase